MLSNFFIIYIVTFFTKNKSRIDNEMKINIKEIEKILWLNDYFI